MNIKCPYCSGDCDDSGALVWKCPHCAKIVTCAAGSRNAPHEILRDIVAAFGEEILADRAMFRNILSDAAPNMPVQYRKLFVLAVDDNIHDKLKHADDTNSLKHRFAEENCINRENADKIVDCFAYALGKIQTVTEHSPDHRQQQQTSDKTSDNSIKINEAKALIDDEQYDKAAEILAELDGQGNAEAQQELDKLYKTAEELYKKVDDGDFDDFDEEIAAGETAFKIFNALANQGNDEAMASVGRCYKWGIGVDEDDEKADKWFEKSIRTEKINRKKKQSPVKNLFDDAKENIDKKSFAEIKALAEQGNVEAMYYLGVCYYNGFGTDSDWEKCREWTFKAAELGFAKASYSIGGFYEYKDCDLPKDFAKAAEWFRKAIQQGYPDAQKSLDKLKSEGKI